jgi:AraC-like DNA-binding protein
MEESSLTTIGLPKVERVPFWADLVCSSFVELDCEVPAPEAFHGKIDRLQAGELELYHVTSSQHVVTRTRARIARSNEDGFLLSLQTSGRGTVSQGGRQAVLQAGDFAIYDTTRPYDLRFDDDFSQLVLRLPRRIVTGRIAEIDRLTAQPIAGNRGMGKLASTFLRELHAQLGDLDPLSLPRVHASAVDLIAAAVAEQSGSHVETSECHLLLRRRVSAYIDRNLADSRLSCETIAAAHGISARHLRKVFEDASMSVSELIWARRLEQARRDLIDPLHAHVSVTSIGYDVGFKDSAHFSRAFKSAFDVTPSAYRAKTHDNFDTRSAVNK